MWDLIVSVPDHCLSFYFGRCRAARGFYYKLVVGALLWGGEGPMKSVPEPLFVILLPQSRYGFFSKDLS